MQALRVRAAKRNAFINWFIFIVVMVILIKSGLIILIK